MDCLLKIYRYIMNALNLNGQNETYFYDFYYNYYF